MMFGSIETAGEKINIYTCVGYIILSSGDSLSFRTNYICGVKSKINIDRNIFKIILIYCLDRKNYFIVFVLGETLDNNSTNWSSTHHSSGQLINKCSNKLKPNILTSR